MTFKVTDANMYSTDLDRAEFVTVSNTALMAHITHAEKLLSEYTGDEYSMSKFMRAKLVRQHLERKARIVELTILDVQS